jgi:tRNA acetyltransferase TAN1
MLSAPGISVSAVQGKERVAEREILEALEEAADELYPETKEAGAGGAASANDDEDIEDALKKELAELSGGSGGKSKRFRMTKRDSACGELIVLQNVL